MKPKCLKIETSRKKGSDLAPSSDRDAFFPDHIRIEERSIALHWAVSERVRENPKLMEKAQENLHRYMERFSSDGSTPPRPLLEWVDILKSRTIAEVLEFIVSPSDGASRLRQSSPFAGILTPQERWKIYEAYRPGAYYTSRRKHHRRQ